MIKQPRRARLGKRQWLAFPFCIILFCGSPNSGASQINDCDSILLNEADSLTGKNIIRSHQNIVISDDGGKTGFAILGALTDSTFIISIRTVGAGACVNAGDQINFLFDDGSTLELTNMAAFNCEAKSSVYFNLGNNNFDALEALSEKTITSLTVWTRKSFLSKSLNAEAAKKVHNLLSCFNRTSGDDTFVKLLNNSVYTRVEKQPEFTGGLGAMMDFMKQNLRYPSQLRKTGGGGTVYVAFLVNRDGSITDVQTQRGVSPEVDAEAERVIRLMPPWVPGMHHGKAVTVRFVLPIRFKIS